MSGDTLTVTTATNSRLERMARALEELRADRAGEDWLGAVLSGALELTEASRGYAVLMDGSTVVSEVGRSSQGEDFAADEDTRKLAARTAMRLGTSAGDRHVTIEAHGPRAGLFVAIDGSRVLGLVLDRPDDEADPGLTLTACYALGAAATQRAAAHHSHNGNGHSNGKEHGEDTGVGAVRFLKTVDELERDAIELALRQTHWKKDEAARKLGISRASIYMKVKKFGLQRPPQGA